MSNETIETATPAPEAASPKGKRKPTKKARAVKKSAATKKGAIQPKAARANKKAEVIGLMQRSKGATLDEITKVTGWQAHVNASLPARPTSRII